MDSWFHGFDCIVLSRNDLLRFFDMEKTPDERMECIKKDIKPWFQGFISFRPRSNNPTFVSYLLLSRREADIANFLTRTELSDRGVKQLLKKVKQSNGLKIALFSEVVNEGRVPTQKEILSELVLVVSGLEPPDAKGGMVNQQRRLNDSTQVDSPQPKLETEDQKAMSLRPVIFKKI